MKRNRTAIVFVAIIALLLIAASAVRRMPVAPLDAMNVSEPASRRALRDGPFIAPAIAYQPRGFVPGSQKSKLSRADVLTDLRLLRSAGFRSLVTYGSDGVLGVVPELARQEGFTGTIVMGIWDPHSEEEWNNALNQSPFVDGYCVGNEGLGTRYHVEELEVRLDELRRRTGGPVTTSEPINRYLQGPYREWLLAHSDWLFPIAHPYWAHKTDPQQAVNWALARHDYLSATSGRRVMLKEVGFPSGGAPGASQDAQRAFFEMLGASGLSFFFFEAFDQPWKVAEIGRPQVEAHWGLYSADGTPKTVVGWVASHWSTP